MIEDAIVMQGLVGVLSICILILFLMWCMGHIFTRSKEYRRLMTDMFVVGKTKQIASKEGLDLLVELREFAKFMKQKNIDFESLDSTIERELQEKIAECSLTEKEKK